MLQDTATVTTRKSGRGRQRLGGDKDQSLLLERFRDLSGKNGGDRAITHSGLMQGRVYWTRQPPADPDSDATNRFEAAVHSLVLSGILVQEAGPRGPVYRPGPNYAGAGGVS